MSLGAEVSEWLRFPSCGLLTGESRLRQSSWMNICNYSANAQRYGTFFKGGSFGLRRLMKPTLNSYEYFWINLNE